MEAEEPFKSPVEKPETRARRRLRKKKGKKNYIDNESVKNESSPEILMKRLYVDELTYCATSNKLYENL